MFKVIVLIIVAAFAGEYLYRKVFPKVKAEVVAVETKAKAEVAVVKADVASVETKVEAVKADVSKVVP